MYRYTGCGLRNVWLVNGYQIHKTAYGEGVAIEDLEGLHRAIAAALITYKPRLTGSEFRFLRKELDMSQAKLARLIGNTEQVVSLWERTSKIPVWADRLIRVVYRAYTSKDTKVRDLFERFSETNREAVESEELRLELEETPEGWRQRAA